MAASGIGRGRGWLNLYKQQQQQQQHQQQQQQQRPGGVPESVTVTQQTQEVSLNSTMNQLNISEYAKLISHINMMNENDDGIRFNQKLKAIVEVWKESCKTDADVQQSVSCVYQACLTKDDFASKVVNMVTANTFSSLTICDTKIRNVFISLVQMYFEKRETIRLENVSFFRRSIKIFGGIFHKGRFVDGRPFTFLADPFVQYLEMLLEFAEPEDLELFTAQLYLNGSAIKQALPEKLNQIMADVRNLLISKSNATVKCKMWLLLAVEVSNHRFGVLPSDLQEFYQHQLGDKAMAYFQGSHNILSVQTMYASKTLDGYKSNVNVLQVSTPEVSPASDVVYYDNAKQTNQKFYDYKLNNSEQGMMIGKWDGSRGEKTGRPILGAGARLNKENLEQHLESRKQYNNSQPHRRNKGWEHDDRFENNYD